MSELKAGKPSRSLTDAWPLQEMWSVSKMGIGASVK
jgi:hypothetical protein